jgi:endonuclease/exonuclease/phosphatase family metal-dependent hydrolase
LLIRSWNLFHGNTRPPQRRTFLEEMIRLATEDNPDVLLLQEIPAWALEKLAEWSGMTAIGDVAQRPSVGPVPIPTKLGRLLTSIHPGALRSAFSGQGNAILLAPQLQTVSHEVLTLNPRGFRRATARRLGIPPRRRLAWAKERRVCSVVRIEPRLVVANLHATSSPLDPRLPAVELARAVAFVEEQARIDDIVVIGGDFNVGEGRATIRGWSAPGQAIDHILVRGARPTALRVWPDERRRAAGMLLSDHAPVELDL